MSKIKYSSEQLSQSGIYAIIHKESGRRYVGSTTKNFRKRWREHKAELRRDVHKNSYLQFAWNKYSEFAFDFVILEFVSPEYCIQREQWWIDLFGCYDRQYGYNISPSAGNTLGYKHSDETKQKISKANTGNKHTEESRQKISEAGKGKKRSEETKLKISQKLKGRVFSEEHKDKHAEAISYLWKIIPPEGESFIIKNLRKFCRENEWNHSNVYKVIRGKWSNYKGYKIEKITDSLL